MACNNTSIRIPIRWKGVTNVSSPALLYKCFTLFTPPSISYLFHQSMLTFVHMQAPPPSKLSTCNCVNFEGQIIGFESLRLRGVEKVFKTGMLVSSEPILIFSMQINSSVQS